MTRWVFDNPNDNVITTATISDDLSGYATVAQLETKQDKGNYATAQDLATGLAAKQPAGSYATTAVFSAYAAQTDTTLTSVASRLDGHDTTLGGLTSTAVLHTGQLTAQALSIAETEAGLAGNTTQLADHEARILILEGEEQANAAAHDAAETSLTARVTACETELGGHTTELAGHTTEIVEITARLAELKALSDKDAVNLASTDVTGVLPAANVDSSITTRLAQLKALSNKDTVNLALDVTGVLPAANVDTSITTRLAQLKALSNKDTVNLATDVTGVLPSTAIASSIAGTGLAYSNGVLSVSTNTTTNPDALATGHRNRLINGAFNVNIRYPTPANATTNPSYFFNADRWYLSAPQSTVGSASFPNAGRMIAPDPNASVQPLPSGFRSYCFAAPAINQTIPASNIQRIAQNIEYANVSDLAWGTAAGLPVTLSFWVHCDLAGTYSASLRDSSTKTTTSYVTTYTVPAANVWQRVVITIPAPPVAAGAAWGNYLAPAQPSIELSLGWNGSQSTRYTTSTLNVWGVASYANVIASTQTDLATATTTVSKRIRWTGIQLEAGTNANPFGLLPLAAEEAMCRRYHQAIRTNAPNGGSASSYAVVGTGYVSSVTTCYIHIYLPVPLRQDMYGTYAPNNLTLLLSSPTHFQIWNSGAANSYPCTAITLMGDTWQGNYVTLIATTGTMPSGVNSIAWLRSNNTNAGVIAFDNEYVVDF